MVIVAMHLNRTKESLNGEVASAIAFLHGPSRLMVGEKLLIAKELLKQAAGILVQSLAQPLLQPLHGATTQTLLAQEALTR
jgi:hypothetical protein